MRICDVSWKLVLMVNRTQLNEGKICLTTLAVKVRKWGEATTQFHALLNTMTSLKLLLQVARSLRSLAACSCFSVGHFVSLKLYCGILIRVPPLSYALMGKLDWSTGMA